MTVNIVPMCFTSFSESSRSYELRFSWQGATSPTSSSVKNRRPHLKNGEHGSTMRIKSTDAMQRAAESRCISVICRANTGG